MPRKVFLVVNGVVLAAYSREDIADIHARTVTGGRVQPVMILDQLPAEVRDDIQSESEDMDDWEEALTPVELVEDVPKIPPCRSRGCLAPLGVDGRCVVHYGEDPT